MSFIGIWRRVYFSRIHIEKHISKNEHSNFAHNQGENYERSL